MRKSNSVFFMYRMFAYILTIKVLGLFYEITAQSLPTRYASLTVISPDGGTNFSLPGQVAWFDPSTLLDGLVGSLIGSRPLNGCQNTSSIPSEAVSSSRAEILLVQRGGCNISDKVQHAEDVGYNAVIVFDNVRGLPPCSPSLNATLFSIPVIFVSFVDGGLLLRNFQYYTGSYVVISLRNASLTSGTGDRTPDRGSEIANVLLGFIPTVSYVCIIIFLLLIIVTRRFWHCSIFVCYKMVTHNPRVAPELQVRIETSTASGEGARCPICLENFRQVDQIHSILPCQHMFHQKCIDHWLRSGKLACPLCRRRITLARILQQAFWAQKASTSSQIFTLPSTSGPVLDCTVQAPMNCFNPKTSGCPSVFPT